MSEDKKDDFMTPEEIHQKTVEFNTNSSSDRGNKTTENGYFASKENEDIASQQTNECNLDDFTLRNTSKIINAESAPTKTLPFPQIPEIEITNIIGEGGMGFVYKGKQSYIDRDVAVKVMKLNGSSNFTERFKREAKILASLAHPNIVSCYQAGVTELNQCYIVMEFIEGQELHSYITENGPLSERQALYIIECLAQALQYAWEKGVMHRDIKSENVLLQKIDNLKESSYVPEGFPYKVKLVDLGLAKGLENKDGESNKNITQAGYILGTPSNMAPEQFESNVVVDYRADIYALGCVLFFLLTGKRAYKSTSIVEIIKEKLVRPIPDPGELSKKLSPEIRDFTKYLLQGEIEKRPQTYDEIIRIASNINGFKGKRQDKTQKSGNHILMYAIIAVVVLGLLGAWIFAGKNLQQNSNENTNSENVNNNNTNSTNTDVGNNNTRKLVWQESQSLFGNDYLNRLQNWQTNGVWASYEEGKGVIGARTGDMFHVLPQAPWRIDGNINSLNIDNREFGIKIVFSELWYTIKVQSLTKTLFIISFLENNTPLKTIKINESQFSYQVVNESQKLIFLINNENVYETFCSDTPIKLEAFVNRVQSVHFEKINLQQGSYE